MKFSTRLLKKGAAVSFARLILKYASNLGITFPSNRVAIFFLVQTYQNGGNIPNDHKLCQAAINNVYQMYVNIPNDHKIYELFTFQGPPKVPKFVFLV
jgi:hypothetical protein